MGCGSSKTVVPPGGYGQSAELRRLLVGSGDGDSSPSPALNLADEKGRGEVDGVVFGELFRAGFVHLFRNKEDCNKINVFPVPDGDTGTNMVITTRPVLISMGAQPDADVAKTAMLVSGQTTLNAQGNSGTIFSFTFSKLAKAIGQFGKPSLTIAEFADALASVSEQMTKAMDNPFPGTMLSVIGAAFSKEATGGAATVGDLVKNMQKAGNAALRRTTDELIVDGVKVLKNFRGKSVVDSGSQGFCYLLDGMSLAIDGSLEYGDYMEPGTAGDVALDEGVIATNEVVVHNEEMLTFKYCTECVGEIRNGVTEDEIRDALNAARLGDSLGLIITTLSPNVSLAKIHIHSNEPTEVFRTVRRFTKDGHLYKEKCEDMAVQVSLSKNPRKIPNPDNADVGIVWTSVADVPSDMRDVWKEGMVPLIVTVDSSSYKDKVSIDSLAFFNMMRRRDFYKVGTAGWNVDDVGAAIKTKLAKHKEVLVISLPFGLSKGTGNAVENALKLLPPTDRERVTMFQHNYIAPPEGSIVMRAHYFASQGKKAAEIKQLCSDFLYSKSTFACVYFDSLTYLRLGGRLADKDKGIMKKVYDYIENKQLSIGILTDFTVPDEHKPDVANMKPSPKLMGPEEKIIGKLVAGLKEMASASSAKQFDMSVSHSAMPADTANIVEQLRASINIRHIYYSEMTAVLGVHGGPGLKGIMLWPADEVEFPQL